MFDAVAVMVKQATWKPVPNFCSPGEGILRSVALNNNQPRQFCGANKRAKWSASELHQHYRVLPGERGARLYICSWPSRKQGGGGW